jgi:hypothetical protein
MKRKWRPVLFGALVGLLIAGLDITLHIFIPCPWALDPMFLAATPIMRLLTAIFFHDCDPMVGLIFTFPAMLILSIMVGAVIGLFCAKRFNQK